MSESKWETNGYFKDQLMKLESIQRNIKEII